MREAHECGQAAHLFRIGSVVCGWDNGIFTVPSHVDLSDLRRTQCFNATGSPTELSRGLEKHNEHKSTFLDGFGYYGHPGQNSQVADSIRYVDALSGRTNGIP